MSDIKKIRESSSVSSGHSTRVVYWISIGVPFDAVDHVQIAMAKKQLDEKLTRLVGGVTRYLSAGTWTPGAEVGDYGGVLERDVALTYSISMLPDKEAMLFPAIKDVIAEVARGHHLPIEHIHANRLLTEERIFRISDVPAKRGGAEEAA